MHSENVVAGLGAVQQGAEGTRSRNASHLHFFVTSLTDPKIKLPSRCLAGAGQGLGCRVSGRRLACHTTPCLPDCPAAAACGTPMHTPPCTRLMTVPLVPPASVTLLLLAACLTCWPQHTASPRLNHLPPPRCRQPLPLTPLCTLTLATSISCRTPHASSASFFTLLLRALRGWHCAASAPQWPPPPVCVCVGGQAKQQHQLSQVESAGSVPAGVTADTTRHCCDASWCVCCFVVRAVCVCWQRQCSQVTVQPVLLKPDACSARAKPEQPLHHARQ